MNLPTYPTDSLHKFRAITGLLLIVFAIYLVAFVGIKVCEINKEINSEIGAAEAESKVLHILLDSLEITKNLVGSKSSEDRTPEFTPSQNTRLTPFYGELRRRAEAIVKDVSASEVKMNQQTLLVIAFWVTVTVGAILIAVGVPLSLKGFARWRVIQDAQDALLLDDAKLKAHDLRERLKKWGESESGTERASERRPG